MKRGSEDNGPVPCGAPSKCPRLFSHYGARSCVLRADYSWTENRAHSENEDWIREIQSLTAAFRASIFRGCTYSVFRLWLVISNLLYHIIKCVIQIFVKNISYESCEVAQFYRSNYIVLVKYIIRCYQVDFIIMLVAALITFVYCMLL